MLECLEDFWEIVSIPVASATQNFMFNIDTYNELLDESRSTNFRIVVQILYLIMK